MAANEVITIIMLANGRREADIQGSNALPFVLNEDFSIDSIATQTRHKLFCSPMYIVDQLVVSTAADQQPFTTPVHSRDVARIMPIDEGVKRGWEYRRNEREGS